MVNITAILPMFIGVWNLVNTSSADANGNPTGQGRAAVGKLTYTADMRVQAQLQNPTLTYTGPFHINEQFAGASPDGLKGQVVHGPLTASSQRTFVGQSLPRLYSFRAEGAYLVLTAAQLGGGDENLFWMKTAANATLP